MKVKPYQFGLATISGFRDHLHITRIRTNRNQLVNIYLITGEQKIVEDLVDTNLIQLDTETTACYADQDDDIIFEDFARLRLKGEMDG